MTTRTVPVSLKIFSIIFIFVSFFLMQLHEKNWLYLTQTTQTNYIIFIVGLFFYKPYDLYIYVFILYISSKTNWPADSSHCIPEQSLLFCRDNNYCANTNIFWILNNPEGKWRRNILLFPSNKLCINFLCCYFFKPFKRNLHLRK